MKFILCLILSNINLIGTAQNKTLDTIKVVMLVSDTCTNLEAAKPKDGYAVLVLKHWYETGNSVAACCVDYWETISFLDELKNPLSKVIVWKSLPSSWYRKRLGFGLLSRSK